MLAHIKPAIMLTLVLTVLTGVIYPLAVTGLAGLMFPHQAGGSLTPVGSELIGQNFTRAEYFHPRPSAAGNGYDAGASSGSNLGPTNPDLAKRLTKDAAAYRAENHWTQEIPADAITTSGSGLDPDITPANALIQAGRVALARGATADDVRALVQSNITGRQFGLLGEPRVNVLQVNRALDARYPVRK